MNNGYEFKTFMNHYMEEVMQYDDLLSCAEDVLGCVDSCKEEIYKTITESELKHMDIGFAMGFTAACKMLTGSAEFVVNVKRT